MRFWRYQDKISGYHQRPFLIMVQFPLGGTRDSDCRTDTSNCCRSSLAGLSADVSDAHSCKARFVSKLIARVRSTERVLVFGENVEPLRTIARGLARRFGWELDESSMDGEEILYIDGKVSQSIRLDR